MYLPSLITADGNIKSLRIGTDLITDYAYDLNKNLTTIRTTLGGGSIVCDNRYTYDGNGNRLSKADRQGLTKYAYDANNQLVQVQYPQGGLENYSYDAAGNRLGRSADGIQENYRYDNCNRLIQLTRMTTQQETVTYSYDRQGNMLSDGRNQYTYDDFGRLVLAVTAEGGIQKNCYDAEGLRTEMEENGRLVQFLYNEDREVVAEKDYSGNIIRYIRGLGLISSDSENAKAYYHYVSDEQGSVSHIIRGEDKESGVSEQGREQDRILNQYEYDAFGNTISCKEQVENRFRYQGEQYDPITRQYYLRARYYNPVIGRFIQEDTYYGDGLNLYEYCRNNTITYKDPTGHNICATQRDLYHKYREEGMNAQEAFYRMRKELGLPTSKDSKVNKGNQYSIFGEEHYKAYQKMYGAENVEWTSRDTLSSADRMRVAGWDYAPSDELYIKYKNVYQNDLYFNQATGAVNWPICDGFVENTITQVTIKKGTILSRFGSPSGEFLGASNDSFEARSLAPFSDYRINKDIELHYYKATEDFEMTAGKIAPWFDFRGGGTQYLKYKDGGKKYSIQELCDPKVGLLEDVTKQVKEKK